MKKFLQSTIMALGMFLFSAVSWAGSVTIPNSFTANTTAVAADVNANFDALENAVDDNDGRIAALEALIATLQADLAAANSAIATNATNIGTNTTDLAAKADAGHGHAQGDVTGLTTDIVPNLGSYLSITTDANGYDTALFTGVNVQVVNGVDQITPNGLGNLIVGYNEARTNVSEVCSDGRYDNLGECEAAGETWALDHKTGSHNLVAGSQNSYSQHGGVVFGFRNAVNREYAGVTGGFQNIASGYQSSVSGGDNNTASGMYSIVSGGSGSRASGDSSSVSGGYLNTAGGYSSSVSGGYQNIASGGYSSVSGGGGNGTGNVASNDGSSILGGSSETTTTDYEAVVGSP